MTPLPPLPEVAPCAWCGEPVTPEQRRTGLACHGWVAGAPWAYHHACEAAYGGPERFGPYRPAPLQMRLWRAE